MYIFHFITPNVELQDFKNSLHNIGSTQVFAMTECHNERVEHTLQEENFDWNLNYDIFR